MSTSVFGQPKAVFSEFTYEGHDSFYDEHPLSADDQTWNPILQGWSSDPSVCADDQGNYWLVTSTFSGWPGVPLYHSTDLLNWRQVGNILTRPEQLPLMGQDFGKSGIYAASMFYNRWNKTYYMITTNMGRMTLHRKPGNFIVKAKDPRGPWSDPIWLENMGGIDPSMYFERDRAYVLYCRMHNREYPGHNSIIMQEYDLRGDSVITSTARVIADKGARPEEKPTSLEGPHLYKIRSQYYLLCAEGGTELRHSEVVFRSKKLWGEYVSYASNPILTQRDLGPRKDGIYCTGHADIFQDQKGRWWSVFLGTRRIDGQLENLGRETFLMPVEWTKDGWPVITRQGEQVPAVVTIPGAKRDDSIPRGNFTVCETFDAPELAPYWMTIRSSASDLYSLTEQPSNLVLKCGPSASDASETPAFVGRRLQHHSFTATTRMTFHPEDNERAGLLLMKSEQNQYFLAVGKKYGRTVVEALRVGEAGRTESLAYHFLGEQESITLRISSADGYTFAFAYSTDDGHEWHTLIDGLDASYTATNVEGTASSFTGTLVGMYALKSTSALVK